MPSITQDDFLNALLDGMEAPKQPDEYSVQELREMLAQRGILISREAMGRRAEKMYKSGRATFRRILYNGHWQPVYKMVK